MIVFFKSPCPKQALQIRHLAIIASAFLFLKDWIWLGYVCSVAALAVVPFLE